MRHRIGVFAVPLLSLCFLPLAQAQDSVVPAGTLLRCTMNEPNFSSKTAEVGDPVLCHLGAIQEFGRNVFPRGAYLGGHLEADKEPGHFFGKGYLNIVFDRIAMPNADLALETKVIAAKGYTTDKHGDIKGNGHPKRDVVEWLLPPLWPWKVMTLPARGPRPTLKGEEILTLRLMEGVVVPRLSATVNYNNSRDWRPPYAQQRPSAYRYQSRATAPAAAPIEATNANYVVSVDPELTHASASTAPASGQRDASSSLTLIALHNETIYAVTSYWLDGDRLDYVLPSGTRSACALTDLDLARTTQLNSERGIAITLREAPPAQLAQ